MSHPTLPPRAQAVVDRFETWSDGGPVRRVGVRALVTVGGPLVVVVGIGMLVLPGPGLVVIALGLALLALEYEWARTGLAWLGHGLSRAKQAALPTGASPMRRITGLLGTAGFLVATTLLTGAITAYVGSLAIL
jgi:uncharacterized protein (TIGR02611 family)